MKNILFNIKTKYIWEIAEEDSTEELISALEDRCEEVCKYNTKSYKGKSKRYRNAYQKF